MDKEMVDFLAEAIGVVEANSFEQLALWKERGERVWDESMRHGLVVTVGELAGMPVCISLMRARIDGHLLLFMDATSQVVDYRLIDEWLSKNLPVSAQRGNGLPNRVDAMNFSNIFPRR